MAIPLNKRVYLLKDSHQQNLLHIIYITQ